MATLDRPHNVVIYRILFWINRRISLLSIVLGTVVIFFSLIFIPESSRGTVLIVTGLFIAFIAAIIMSAVSLPGIYKLSPQNRMVHHVSPAFEALAKGDVVEKGDEGFYEAIYVFEALNDTSFDDPESIVPYGDDSLQAVEVEGTQYPITADRLHQLYKELKMNLDISSNHLGSRLLALGFIIQIMGVLVGDGIIG